MAIRLLEPTRTVEPDGTVVLHLRGEIDTGAAVRVRYDALGVIAAKHPIALDLHDVVYFDAEAIETLAFLSRSLVAGKRARLELRNVPPRIARAFTESGHASAFRMTLRTPY